MWRTSGKPTLYLGLNDLGRMTPMGNPGRFAGLLYVLTSIVGFFAMGYVPGKLIVHGNTAATVNNITAHEMLFRFGIAGQLISQTAFIFVAIALYKPVPQSAWPRIGCCRIVLETLALSARAAGVQVSIPAAVSGCLARPCRGRLGHPEPGERSAAAIPERGLHVHSTRCLRRDCIHVVAVD
jgi:hypothetical protein